MSVRSKPATGCQSDGSNGLSVLFWLVTASTLERRPCFTIRAHGYFRRDHVRMHHDERTTMKRSVLALLAATFAGAMLVGCSAPSVQGGDTSCKDYLAADDQTKTEAVTKM